MYNFSSVGDLKSIDTQNMYDILKSFPGQVKDAVIIGISNRIEIWDTQTWQDFYANSNESFEQIAENMID